MERAVRIAKKLLPFAGAAVFLLAVYAIHRELAGVRAVGAARDLCGDRGGGRGARASRGRAELRGARGKRGARRRRGRRAAVVQGGFRLVRRQRRRFQPRRFGYFRRRGALAALYSALGFDPARIGRVIASTQAAFVFGPLLAGALAFVIAPDGRFRPRAAWLGSARWLLAARSVFPLPAAAFVFSFRGSIPWIEGQRLALPSPRGVCGEMSARLPRYSYGFARARLRAARGVCAVF